MNIKRYKQFNEILLIYHPIIKKYSSGSEDLEQELNIFLWNLLNYTKKISFKSDECYDYYIKKSIKREYWKLSKKQLTNRNKFLLDQYINERYISNELFYTIHENPTYQEIEFDDIIKDLKNKQKLVMKLKYYYNLSDIEIGKILHLSRQRINQINKDCINYLKKNVQHFF